MTAEIVSLPRRTPPVRLVFSSTSSDASAIDRHSLIHLADAADALLAAQCDLSEGGQILLRAGHLPDHSPLLTGEALESVLRAGLELALFSGASNRDRSLMRAMREWLQTNGSSDHG